MHRSRLLRHASCAFILLHYRLVLSLVALGCCGNNAFAVTVAPNVVEMRMCNSPSLSADGSRLVVAWLGDIWIGSSYGGVMQRLTASPAKDSVPMISPDGRQVAFVSDRSGSDQIYVMPIDGGTLRQMTFHSEGSTLQDWSPDGKSLLTHSRRDHFWTRADRLFLVSVDAEPKETLAFDAYAKNGRFAGSSDRILFTRHGAPWWRQGYRGAKASQIWRANTAGKETDFERLSLPGAEARSPLPLSSTGEIVYSGNQNEGVFNLYRSSDGKKHQQLTHFSQGMLASPSVAREASLVVFRHSDDLYRLDLSSPDAEPQKISLVCHSDMPGDKVVRRVLRKCSEADFTKDGLEIAFVAGGDLWVSDTVLREPRRVTTTPGQEVSARFSPAGDQIAFVSEQEGQTDIWIATRRDPEAYWWMNREFQMTRVTEDSASESHLRWSPQGDRLAYMRGSGDLVVLNLKSRSQSVLHQGWRPVSFDWSPNGKWISFSTKDENYNADIYLVSADGASEPVNLSRHPDNDTSPVWSPDNEKIAFTGRRENGEVDIFLIYVGPQPPPDSDRSATLLSAVEAMRDSRGKEDRDRKDRQDKASEEESSVKGSTPIDLSSLLGYREDRIVRIDNPGVRESQLIWSPDSRQIAFRGDFGSNEDATYTLKIESDSRPRRRSGAVGRPCRWLEDGDQILWLSNGVPGKLDLDGDTTSYPFKAYSRFLESEYYGAVFDHSWRTVRDTFYDQNYHGVDWQAVREHYLPMALQSRSREMLADVILMSLGELNASHQRLTLKNRYEGDSWSEKTRHLGCFFDRSAEGKLCIATLLRNARDAGLKVGDQIVKIDGAAVHNRQDIARLLTGPPNPRVEVTLQRADATEQTVMVLPITYSEARQSLYDLWVKMQSKQVAELSEGRFGYLHIKSMGTDNLARFEKDLYSAGQGKSGLVIDVRFNGGGRIADYLLSMLNHPHHAITSPRGGSNGYPQDRRVFATWDKPIVVLCNESSASNAEIFCHAVKTTGRGKVVGMPSAGYVLTAETRRLMDFGSLRITKRGWLVVGKGVSMEGVGVIPNHIVEAFPGELPNQIDRQLQVAVEVLLRASPWGDEPP